MYSKNLILTISLGKERNFIEITKDNIQKYANKTNSDFIIIDDNSEIINDLDKTLKVGRKNGIAYILKIYCIYKYLEIYEKILWLDDTCLIKNNTENLFDLLNDNYIAGFNEGKNKNLNSWQFDQKFIKNNMNFDIDPVFYINSGIVLYSNKIRNFLSLENINNNYKLLQSLYPHQAFLNYIIQKNNIPLKLLDESFNIMFINDGYTENEKNLLPENIIEKNIIKDSNKIYHITGFYKNRYNILMGLKNIYIKYNL